MKVFVINNFGAGFADTVELPAGTTIKSLFEQTVKHASPQDYLIRLNRGPVAADYVLQEGDRDSITPRKIEGALSQVKLRMTPTASRRLLDRRQPSPFSSNPDSSRCRVCR